MGKRKDTSTEEEINVGVCDKQKGHVALGTRSKPPGIMEWVVQDSRFKDWLVSGVGGKRMHWSWMGSTRSCSNQTTSCSGWIQEVVWLKGGKSTGWGLEVVQIKAGGRRLGGGEKSDWRAW
uniref:Uncharacterized protein n=1 Tax=Timema poppense TaxID=170557 RepID=A0A7R9GYI3_TIMPO|nr:unnamed protein product [Timema poppensis]